MPWSTASEAYEASKQNFYAFDLARAKALVQESGLSNIGFDWLTQPTQTELANFGQIYQADLANIGVKLNLKPLDAALWVDQVTKRQYTGLYVASGNAAVSR